MRKAIGSFENLCFLFAALLFFVASATTAVLRSHIHFHNDRVQYGMQHLPAELLGVFLFVALVGIGRAYLSRSHDLAEKSPVYYLGLLVLVFSMCWLPTLLVGGFVADDWDLLAAASIRKIIYLHPAYSWHALDSVNGNFRPLGTVLYIGYMLKLFGASAFAMLAGSFVINLLGCLVSYLIVRELGYSRIAGAAASLLYMTRGAIYTINAWVAALGDALVILFCGLMALAILKANKRAGAAALAYHAVALACFVIATLAKQSSFAAPLIVALLLLLQPGKAVLSPLAQRIRSSVLGLLVYGGIAGILFFHAKALLQGEPPYPISLSLEAVLQNLPHAIWYVWTVALPPRFPGAIAIPELMGALVIACVLFFLWKVPRVLGERPRDVLFAMLAAVASVTLFLVLSTRSAPYYGSMADFWMSIALGIALTRFGQPSEENRAGRIGCFAFCLLLTVGFANVRLAQTGLMGSGGYIWGTYGMDTQREQLQSLQKALASSPRKDTLVLVDFSPTPSDSASMALLAAPDVRRILGYDSSTRRWMANNRQGLRPGDEFDALKDFRAYNWEIPMDAAEAASLTSQDQALWLKRDGNQIEQVKPIP